MSHRCPDCDALCFCNGDIDDCCMNLDEDTINCTHYIRCQQDSDEDESWEMELDGLGKDDLGHVVVDYIRRLLKEG